MRRLVCALGAVAALPLAAEDSVSVGPRAIAMGGANVASVDPALAQVHNPAAFGFMARAEEEGEGSAVAEALGGRVFGLSLLDFSLGLELTGDFGEHLDTLAGFDHQALSSDIDLSPAEIAELATAANALVGIDDPGNAFLLHLNGGGGVRFGRVAVGVRAFGSVQAAVREIDLANLGLNFSGGSALGTEIANTALADPDYPGTGGSTLTPSQHASLAAQLGADGNAAADYIDYQLTQLIADGAIDPGLVDQEVDLLLDIIAATGSGGDLADNTTSVFMQGLGVVEIPVSYGHMVADGVAVGATARLMFGRVYGQRVLVFSDDNDAVIEEFDEDYEESVAVGIDLGVLATFGPVTLGLRGRNLNQPTFSGFTDDNGYRFPDVELDPQVTVGVAWNPMATLTLALDVDLLQVDALMPTFERQHVAVGVEWDVARVVALRAGAYQNVAEDDQAPVVSAGVGINLYAARIDLALAAGLDTAEFDGSEYPETLRGGVGIAVDF